MIVAPRFLGDEWGHVMWIQHDLYRSLLWDLFEVARQKYLHAQAMIGVETVAGILVEAERSFDHRVLQDAHDMIAARFRYVQADRLHPELPYKGHEDDRKRIEALWKGFWREEVNRLTDIAPFARAVVTAIAFQNTEEGYKAEDDLRELLLSAYGGEIR